MNPGRILFSLATCALIILQWVWHGWKGQNIAFALMLSVPLLIPLPWVLKGSLKAAGFVFFLSLIHFLHGVTEAIVTAEARAMALLETGLCSALYVGLILWTVANRNRNRKQ